MDKNVQKVAQGLTTFLSSVVVASLLSESNSFSVAKLYFWSSSAVASTKANVTLSKESILKVKLKSEILLLRITDPGSVSDATDTKARNSIGSSNCQSNLIIPPASLVTEVRRTFWSISACLLSEGK